MQASPFYFQVFTVGNHWQGTLWPFDYIVNTADNVPGDQDTGYFAGFRLGKEKKEGDWSLFYKYACIEKDSVIGSMNDQDFYGANRKGHKIMFRYMLFDRLRFGTAFFYTDPVTA